MPKILISHPTLSPHEQLVRHYAGLLKLALTREPKELTEDEKMALCLFSDVKMTYVEHPLYPDQAELRPSLTCSVTRLAPGEPWWSWNYTARRRPTPRSSSSPAS